MRALEGWITSRGPVRSGSFVAYVDHQGVSDPGCIGPLTATLPLLQARLLFHLGFHRGESRFAPILSRAGLPVLVFFSRPELGGWPLPLVWEELVLLCGECGEVPDPGTSTGAGKFWPQ